MDMFENSVDGMVVMPTHSPSFDNSGVVAMDNEVLWGIEESVKSMDQEFKADGFSLSNVFGSPV